MFDYRSQNAQLLSWCLADLETEIQDPHIKECLNLAFKKALKSDSTSIAPPLISLLLAEDLGYGDAPWAAELAVACAYFYTAADLLDDIQDKDPHQPVLKIVSPEQAMNISNFLLMGAYQTLLKSTLPIDRRLALVQLFTQMGSMMSTGQYWDIETTNQRVCSHDPERISKAKTGAELSGFLACAPTALNLSPDIYQQLAEELGFLLQTLTDYFDIWIVPDKYSLSQDLLVLKNGFPLYWARQDQAFGSDVDLALAGKNHLYQKQFHLRRLLAKTQSIQRFESMLKESQAKIQNYHKQAPPLPRIKALCDYYIEQSKQLVSALQQLQEIVVDEKWEPERNLEQSIQMAVDYLNFIPDFQDVWEVQRWGFLDTPTLYGDIFNPLLILEALSLCEQDIRKPLLHTLNKAAEDGWHYYSNTQKIPTDTDDLGQALHLSLHLPQQSTAPLFEKPLQILMRNLESTGKCPTWLTDGELHLREEVDLTWYGNECIAVMANLYYGLACYDPRRFAPQIEQGIKYILQAYQSEKSTWQSAYYASQTYTNYLVARLLKQQQATFSLAEIEQALLAEQLLDGSWKQSAQETAFAVLFLAECWQTQPLSIQQQQSLKSAQAFLIDTQNFEGSWPGEDLFIRPGKGNTHELFAHPKLTSTFCLRALKQTQQTFLN